jgi:hypothetical protein
LTFFGSLLSGSSAPPRTPPRGRGLWRWVGGTSVLLDPRTSRILEAGPKAWVGVHIDDLAELRRQEGAAKRHASCEAPAAPRPRLARSRTAMELAIYSANPKLSDWVDQAGDARGGTFDTINRRFDLKGRAKVTTWRRAVWVATPPCRVWGKLPERLRVLEEVLREHGYREGLVLPDPAWKAEEWKRRLAEYREHVTPKQIRSCRAGARRAYLRLVREAQSGRLGEVPF